MSFIIFLAIISILIIVHEFGHFIAAKKIGVRVEEFFLGLCGKKIFTKKKNGTEYGVRPILLGGYVKLAGDNLDEYKGKPYEYLSQTPSKRAVIIASGPLLNYVLGLLCFWLIFFVGYPTLGTTVGSLIDGFGAKEAGVQIGDRIIAIDGKKVAYWQELQKIVYTKKSGAKVTLSILRDNKEHSIDVELKEKQLNDELGQKRNVSLIGISPSEEIVIAKYGFVKSFLLGTKKTWDLTTMTYNALWLMIGQRLSIREVTGPIGMFFITSKIAREGIIPILDWIGIISVSLAIINLLPLPLLDGGHILFLAIEKIRGRYVSHKTESVITRVGWTTLIIFFIIVSYNDITKFYGENIVNWFNKLWK